jgi:hypothetical protein
MKLARNVICRWVLLLAAFKLLARLTKFWHISLRLVMIGLGLLTVIRNFSVTENTDHLVCQKGRGN